MTATADPDATVELPPTRAALDRANGIELLGAVHGSGYRKGASLVRRADGQMVQLGPLMYGVLEAADGHRDAAELARAVSAQLGRTVDETHVVRLAEKLAAQGLLAGTEHAAPPRRNPLLALRWKVLITDPKITRRLAAPFTFLFHPWLVWPILACFVGVFWFVLFDKGVASATADSFRNPGLLLLVFVLAVASAGFHEIGHAAACRYGGATPGGMGMGIYLVWPAFYTDVTDAYRLPRRDRLRVDLGGIYFNAVVAAVTLGVWLLWRIDALLLLIALQLLTMVKNLSPVIRSDGYHILSDVTGVPDLYAHIGPTIRGLLPWRRHEPSALRGRARLIVTLWVLIVVPVLLSLMFGAVILLPRLATSAWDSGRHVASGIPHDAGHGAVLALLAALVRLLALFLPVVGSALVTQRVLRMAARGGRKWSDGRPARQGALVVAALGAAAVAAWAWWPSGQYQPVRADQSGTLVGFGHMLGTPASFVHPVAAPAPLRLAPGTHLAVAMIPVGGATKQHPAMFVLPGAKGQPAVALLSTSAPDPSTAPHASTTTVAGQPATAAQPATTTDTTATATVPSPTTTAAATTTTPQPTSSTPPPVAATAFPFKLPAAPGPGGTQALAVGTKDGGVVYDVAYALVTVRGGKPVTNTNSAYALASCKACTTVAVAFQLVLIVGRSQTIAPIDAAGALNANCPACMTTAIADQIVVTLTAEPPQSLVTKLEADLRQLDALPSLGAAGTPAAVAAQVAAVQQEIDDQLTASGLLANPPTTTAATTTTASTTTGATTTTAPTTTTGPTTTHASSPAPAPATTTTGTTTHSTATSPTPTTTAPRTTTTAPATTTAPTTTTARSTTTTPAPTTTAPATTTAPTTTAPTATTTP